VGGGEPQNELSRSAQFLSGNPLCQSSHNNSNQDCDIRERALNEHTQTMQVCK
jgi:hypothetical protein